MTTESNLNSPSPVMSVVRQAGRFLQASSLPLGAALLLAYLFAINGPLAVWMANSTLLENPPVGAGWLWLNSFAIAFALLLGIFLILRVISQRFDAVFALLALLFYVQATLIARSYGQINNTGFDFESHNLIGRIETAAWLGLLIWAWFKGASAKLISGLRLAVFGLFAGLFIVDGMNLWSHRDTARVLFESDRLGTELEGEKYLAEFSSGKNAVLLILDSVSADYWQDALRTAELEQEDFPGFTWFRNSVANYDKTNFSVSSLLSGDPDLFVDNASERNDAVVPLANAFEMITETPLSRLEPEGINLDILAFSGRPRFKCDVLTNRSCLATEQLVGPEKIREEDRSRAGMLLSAGLFRGVPHDLKRWVFNSGRWRFDTTRAVTETDKMQVRTVGDISALSFLRNQASLSSSDSPTLKIIHLFTPHRPHDVDANCQHKEWPLDFKTHSTLPQEVKREGAIDAAACMLKLVHAWFAEMQELGVYEDALIIFISDHGSTLHVAIKDKETYRDAVGPDAPKLDGAVHGHERAVPLIMIKQPGDQQFATNDYPVALCDIGATLFDWLEVPHEAVCPSLDAASGDARNRVFWKWHPRERFTRYEVEGHSWVNDSWSSNR